MAEATSPSSMEENIFQPVCAKLVTNHFEMLAHVNTLHACQLHNLVFSSMISWLY